MQTLINKNHLRYAEYGLLVIIIGLIVIFLLNRVRTVHKNAERMAVMGEINALRGGVVAMIDSPGDPTERDLSDMNPVRVLQAPPKDYIGPINDPQKQDIPQSSWYFRPEPGVLVYSSRFAHDFPFTEGPTREIHLTLERPEQAHQIRDRRVLACGQQICLTVK